MTVARLKPSHDVAVLEMGANAPGEIAYLSGIGKPDIAIITCVGSAHLQGFGSIEGVARAKGEMISAPHLHAIVLPVSTKIYYENTIPASVTPIWVGDGENIFSDEVQAQLDGITFVLHDRERAIPLHLPLLGTHNAGNLARAYAAATVLAPIDDVELQKAIAAIQLPSGRMERWTGSDGTSFLHDAYNANPSSMAEAMHLMAKLQAPKCLILGDMRELGPTSSALHEELGKQAADVHPVRILCVGEFADDIARGAIRHGAHPDAVFCIPMDNLNSGLQWLAPSLTPQTVCLIKGSRGVRLERVLDFFHAARQ